MDSLPLPDTLMEENELMNSQKYRAYTSNIDKVLKNFEYSSEWADLILALGKLYRVISNNAQFQIIPRRIKISKRLAQCMHPALPSGVHLKALETYDIIFSCSGVERLASELFIYSSGLFPLLGYAAMNVRSALLQIYEKYFVPLGSRLIPALSGFLSGVLPGYESGLDHFDRTNILLEDVCIAVNTTNFYSCLWECIAINEPIRLAAISFLLDHFDRKLPMKEQSFCMGTDRRILVSALCASLNDAVILVQRNTLEFLLIAFPIHMNVFDEKDLVILMSNALNAILRRDMSLNRRLYSWLLGTEIGATDAHNRSEKGSEQTYFHRYSKNVLIKALKLVLKMSVETSQCDVKPYRIMISLLDKMEIGSVILEHVLCDVIRAMAHSQGNKEVLKSANLLFATFDPTYIWSFLVKLFESACKEKQSKERSAQQMANLNFVVDSGPPSLREVCLLTEFLLETVISFEIYNDVTGIHLPKVFLEIVQLLVSYIEIMHREDVAASLKLCTKIIKRIHPTENLIKIDIKTSSDDEPLITETRNSTLQKSKSDSKLNQIDIESSLQSSLATSTPNLKGQKQHITAEQHNQSASEEMKPLESVQTAALTTSFPDKTTDRMECGHNLEQSSILKECMRQYQIFYEILITSIIFDSPPAATNETSDHVEPNKYIEQLYNLFEINNDFHIHNLESLLQATLLNARATNLVSSINHRLVNLVEKNDIEWRSPSASVSLSNSKHYFKIEPQLEKQIKWLVHFRLSNINRYVAELASGLLMQMSSISVSDSTVQQTNSAQQLHSPTDNSIIPSWLKVLIVQACYLTNDPDLQIYTISSLIESMSILKVRSTEESGTDKPLLQQKYINHLKTNTRVFQVLTSLLWDFLGSKDFNSVQVSSLLYRLNSCLENGVVEIIIARRLAYTSVNLQNEIKYSAEQMYSAEHEYASHFSQYNVERLADTTETMVTFPRQSSWNEQKVRPSRMEIDDFKKFALLWHLGRPLPNYDMFQKTLFKMYDNLLLPYYLPLRSFITKWLQDSLLAGDLSRLLKPILHILLSASTKRVSGLHANFRNAKLFIETETNRRVDSSSRHIPDDSSGSKYQLANTIKQQFRYDIERNRNYSLIINPLDSPSKIDLAMRSSKNQQPPCNTKLSQGSGNQEDDIDELTSSIETNNRNSNCDDTEKTVMSPDEMSEKGSSPDEMAMLLNENVCEDEGIGSENLNSSEPSLTENNGKYTLRSDDCEFIGPQMEYEYKNDRETSDSVEHIAVSRNTERIKPREQFTRRKTWDKPYLYRSFMLFYANIYDTKQVLYAFQTLRNIFNCDPRCFITICMATTVNETEIKQLLLLHRKSVSGRDFNKNNITNSELSQPMEGCCYLEVLLTICLHYARSFFHRRVSQEKQYPTSDDIMENCRIQQASIDLLTHFCNELVIIVRDSVNNMDSCVRELMIKCKLQKIILHCLLIFMDENNTLLSNITHFNSVTDKAMHLEAFQMQLLRLLLAIIKLEAAFTKEIDYDQPTSDQEILPSSPLRVYNKPAFNYAYMSNGLVCQQPIFLSVALSALQSNSLYHLHRIWTDLIKSSLIYFPLRDLATFIIPIIYQICANLNRKLEDFVEDNSGILLDYIMSQFEALTVLWNFCLFDPVQVHFSSIGKMGSSIIKPGQLISNDPQSARKRSIQLATVSVLQHLPVMLKSIVNIWECQIEKLDVLKQRSKEFLKLLSFHYGVNFLASMSVVWHEKEISSSTRKHSCSRAQTVKALPLSNEKQIVLVHIVLDLPTLPLDMFIQTIHQVLKSSPFKQKPRSGFCLDVSALEFCYFYMENAPKSELTDAWKSLLVLLRDSLNFAPPLQFILLSMLNRFIQKSPQIPFSDKKDSRDLHDITSRMVEALSTVAGACLEQTTWLRRSLAVKAENQNQNPETTSKDKLQIGNEKYSVQAQNVLAAVFSNLLDVVYGSQEKDKVVSIVTTVLYNITPYLKNHTISNVPSFYACSSLLASLTGYQYTRKAWRKDVLDLMLDASFFQMDSSCLTMWKAIIDNLMTYDNTTFRELMNRVCLTQTGSLNIFASKEQEYEQRALILKRLAFVIFCSEVDQYQKYMPEIQEQLANSIRLPQIVPPVQAAVFLCFRVLLLRMSSVNVTSLWPIIIAEMIQVLLLIEQELKTDTEESKHPKIITGLDSNIKTSSSSSLYTTGHHQWHMVQLETAKLLELGCLLPASNLPYFQMYRWAFVGNISNGGANDFCKDATTPTNCQPAKSPMFIPHVTRIARLMNLRYSNYNTDHLERKYLVLANQNTDSLQDLHGFFSALNITLPQNQTGNMQSVHTINLDEIEMLLANDFLEPMITGV